MITRSLPHLLASVYLIAAAPAVGIAAQGDCGQPLSTGASPVASDALFTLQAAVQVRTCAPAICDADGNCTVASSDALRILKKAVGEDIALVCPSQCQATSTSSSSSTSMFGSTTSTTSSTSMPRSSSSSTTTTTTSTTTTGTATATTMAAPLDGVAPGSAGASTAPDTSGP